MTTQKVFVIDAEGKPLLPTHPARARKLLDNPFGKATVYQVVPFTILLNRVVENPVGEFTIGIDDGAKKVGIAVVNEKTQEVVFGGTIKLRPSGFINSFDKLRDKRDRGTPVSHNVQESIVPHFALIALFV